jgi:2-oxoglutarate ferredoxin oxidoreductase subunit gamma
MKKSEAKRNSLPASPLDDDRYEIRFSGSGGQGIITAAVILAEAVACYGKHQVCQTQSYGPEARGGTSKADVLISSDTIDYPKAVTLDLLLAMNQASCDTYFRDLKPHGFLVVDSTLVSQVPIQRAIMLPFTRLARETSGKTLVANLVALGAISYIADILPSARLKQAIRKRVPPGTEKMNLRAFDAGIKAVKKIDIDNLPEISSLEEDEL